MLPRIAFVSLLILIASPLAAQNKDAKKKPTPLTVDDIVNTEFAKSLQVSPDGKWVVWVKQTPDKEQNKRVDQLMLTSLTDDREIQLTYGQEHSNGPRWSHKGDRIAFLSSRAAPKGKKKDEEEEKDEAKTKIWLINPAGGEPWMVASFARDIHDVGWKDDDTLVFVAQEKKANYERDRKENKDEATDVDAEEHEPPARLFQVTVRDKKITRLTHNTDRMQSVQVSPDGKWAVTVNERSLSYLFDHKIKPACFLWNLETNQGKRIFDDKFNLGNLYWSPDSKGLYAVNQYTTHPRFVNAYVMHVHHFDVSTMTVTQVPLDWDRGLADGEAFAATPTGFVTLLADGVRHKPARYDRAGNVWKRQMLTGEHASNIYMLAGSPKGDTIVYLYTKAAGPHQWYRASLAGTELTKPAKVFELEPDLSERRLAKAEVVRWKGALDEEIEGVLYYPLDFDMGKKYPLVVLIHGGPAWSDFDAYENTWSYPINLYCARGAFVLQPNYHGGTHYGLKFAESIADGKYYMPVEDIEKGIDFLLRKGDIDAKKIGLSGWSNGAILTMALITRRHYQAASAGAGGSEWVADWGTCDFGMSFSSYYLGKSPLEDPQLYIKNAPFYDFPKVRTPTLFFHGSEDKDVPTHHSWMQFRTLRELGKTDVRFVLFPGEKHGLKKLSHHKRKLDDEMAWFDKYLFKTAVPENVAFKPTSPLAGMLVRQQAKRQGKLFGVSEKDTLVPEVVEHKGLQLGRFEVTRAQFKAFDPKFKIEPGTDNFPANGITLDQAKAYCVWLSKRTVATYRLPELDEAEDLFSSTDGTENTLDHWAGYTITPDDRLRLLPKLRELPGRAPLLREVGSFPCHSKDWPLFDVGGNVAEWVLTPTGARALGGCADLPADDHEATPSAEYIGFRVARGSKEGAEK